MWNVKAFVQAASQGENGRKKSGRDEKAAVPPRFVPAIPFFYS